MGPIKQMLIMIIKGYQMGISQMLPHRCRFYPSCSQYTIDAIESHGILYGILMSVKRLSKCHPFHPGGIDLVNKKGEK